MTLSYFFTTNDGIHHIFGLLPWACSASSSLQLHKSAQSEVTVGNLSLSAEQQPAPAGVYYYSAFRLLLWSQQSALSRVPNPNDLRLQACIDEQEPGNFLEIPTFPAANIQQIISAWPLLKSIFIGFVFPNNKTITNYTVTHHYLSRLESFWFGTFNNLFQIITSTWNNNNGELKIGHSLHWLPPYYTMGCEWLFPE